eukprot:6033387-Heterocapsa_arctica.AAC.1
MNQQDIENEICEDAEPAEAVGSSAPEAEAAAMVLFRALPRPHAPTAVEREEHELTHIPYQVRCRACLESRGKEAPHKKVKRKIGCVPLL